MKSIMRPVPLFVLAAMLAVFLTGCFGNVPMPSVKNGEFDFSVTYEVKGETVTVSGVYVCSFKGGSMHIDGMDRQWEGYVKDADFGNEIEILRNDDGVITLDLGLEPMYFMSDPLYGEIDPEPMFCIKYHEDKTEELGLWSYDEDILADYGVRVISYEYDEPVENTFETE